MLQDEHLRLVADAHIPEAFHTDLDLVARWVRGRRWVMAESDLILEAMVEFALSPRMTEIDSYIRLSRRMEIMGESDGREYAIPSYRDFAHLLMSLPVGLTSTFRGGGEPGHLGVGLNAADIDEGERDAA
ncbi:hypothetical protein [Neorhizobium tomejilense]|uniref:hypothetical protein n=1 Tax=Neorhizobium tomejilense TaxID=2093828 RepID=UPI000CF98F35|nr:hypothetical protein [Neorhizobium tomejilense]